MKFEEVFRIAQTLHNISMDCDLEWNVALKSPVRSQKHYAFCRCTLMRWKENADCFWLQCYSRRLLQKKNLLAWRIPNSASPPANIHPSTLARMALTLRHHQKISSWLTVRSSASILHLTLPHFVSTASTLTTVHSIVSITSQHHNHKATNYSEKMRFQSEKRAF